MIWNDQTDSTVKIVYGFREGIEIDFRIGKCFNCVNGKRKKKTQKLKQNKTEWKVEYNHKRKVYKTGN